MNNYLSREQRRSIIKQPWNRRDAIRSANEAREREELVWEARQQIEKEKAERHSVGLFAEPKEQDVHADAMEALDQLEYANERNS